MTNITQLRRIVGKLLTQFVSISYISSDWLDQGIVNGLRLVSSISSTIDDIDIISSTIHKIVCTSFEVGQQSSKWVSQLLKIAYR